MYFPQWQGSGLKNNVQTGAQALLDAFADVSVPSLNVPLSDEEIAVEHQISGYKPLLAQLQTATALLEQYQPERLLLLTGDCGAEVAPIDYLNKHYNGNLTVLWIDAHADLNTPDSSLSAHFHGMPLRLLLDGEFVDTAFRINHPLHSQQVIFVGLRDTDIAEDLYIHEHSLPVLTDVTFSVERLDELLALHQASNLYIHMDLDVLNPLQFPALQYPTTGGIEVDKIADLTDYLINNYRVVGLSLTETTATQADDLLPIQPILTVYKRWLTGLE